ncbi:MAG: CoA-binding protein [Bacilli bacterium]|nr:CoA-binding protein [Bacilli bacterium]
MTPKELLTIYKNFAVIGVTPDKSKYGYKIYKRLKEKGYHTFGVSPKYQEIDGNKMYENLDVIPSPIDVVVFVINPKYAKEYIGQMRTIGIGYAWMQPGTYNDEILDLMQSHGITPILDCILIQTQ